MDTPDSAGPDLVPIRRALISVSDKSDLIPFARRLAEFNVEIISTGGTARQLREADIPVRGIDDLTGFPEMMGGRVKTLHPRVHGGLLALRDQPDHVASMDEHGIEAIDLVVVNLYPFEQTIARQGVTDPEAIEQIDIGGPSMIRSAAKNHRFVTVVTEPGQYAELMELLAAGDGALPYAIRRRNAAAAFARTAAYDAAIAGYMIDHDSDQAAQAEADADPAARSAAERGEAPATPPTLLLQYHRHPDPLRYGENPHQSAALYVDPRRNEASVATAAQLHGVPLGYCNIFDADGALELVKEIDPDQQAAAAIIKHANPCGFAVDDDLAAAFTKAYDADPLAAFGGIVALNRRVTVDVAEAIVAGRKLLHVILAPEYGDDALDLLRERWGNVRILETGPLGRPEDRDAAEPALRHIVGGLLLQSRDLAPIDPAKWTLAAGPEPDAATLAELRLAAIAVKHLKSNAVCLTRDAALVGGGMGQVDRVAACRLAIQRAGDRAKGSVAASDAFFPFRDGPDLLLEAGIRAIVQPGGSQRDDETIAACRDAGVSLLMTGRRSFRH